MTKLYDVVIAGAGPVGLFLACELGLARMSVLVLERDSKAESAWKSLPLGRRGLNTVAVETLYRRGLLGKVFQPGERASCFEKKPAGFQFGGHFGGVMLDSNKLDLERFKYCLNGPALVPGPTSIERIESVLAQRAEELGVTILRGSGVTAIAAQSGDSVTVQVEKGESFEGRWLVGCDGGRSVVRKVAGFEFVGTEAMFTGYAAKVEWDHFEKLKPGFHITKKGMYIIAGSDSLYLTDFDGGAFDRSQEITQERLQEVFVKISGITDVRLKNVHLTSSFTDRCKQAVTYRKGRVILAGDAAHIHGPIGSQGLNLGLGDAMNLGWKLAATIRKQFKPSTDDDPSDLSLLDSYESERHPAGAEVLEWIRAQVAMLQPGPSNAAMQALLRDLIATNDGTNVLIDRHWGLSQRYRLGDGGAHAHPLVGCSAPDFEFSDGVRLGSKLQSGRGLLVDFKDGKGLKVLLEGDRYGHRVDYVGCCAKDSLGLRALLVRPDGIVAWATEHNVEADIDAPKAALEQWFGF